MAIRFDSRRPTTDQVEDLYRSVGWSLYLHPGLLDACLDGSLWFETAWETPAAVGDGPGEEHLVGLVRVVGDDASIAYVQDLLVRPDRQRRGIGSGLLRDALARFEHVRQFLLLTDDDEASRTFYGAAGLVPVGDRGTVSYVRP